LCARGHQVLWWTSAFSHFTKSWERDKDGIVEISPNYSLYCLRGTGYTRHFSLKRFLDHRVIAKKFKRYAPKVNKPDLMVVSTPPHDLAFEAVRYAKKNHIPVFVDVKDPWPDSFLQHFPKILQKIGKAILFFERRMTRIALRNADGIISVTQPQLQFGLDYAGRLANKYDRVFFNGYRRINPGEMTLRPELESVINKIKQDKKFAVLFIGTFSVTHNPAILIDCAAKLKQHNIVFVLAGAGEFYNELKKQKKDLDNVEFTGWVNKNEIEIIVKYASIGMCPTPFIMDILPNKSLIYLAAGLPVISSFEGDLKELLEKQNAGFYYKPGDLEELAIQILYLYQNPQDYRRISENAKKLYETTFNSDNIYTNYTLHLESSARELLAK
jgi:glycosyltransferase involved in cell wall biosynthesis